MTPNPIWICICICIWQQCPDANQLIPPATICEA